MSNDWEVWRYPNNRVRIGPDVARELWTFYPNLSLTAAVNHALIDFITKRPAPAIQVETPPPPKVDKGMGEAESAILGLMEISDDDW